MGLAPGAIVLDRYRVEGVLGKGGQATVYAAVHVRLGTRVALKVLGNEGDTMDNARLEGEARLTAALDSPYIVKALDVATLPNGQNVIVFERVDGRNLAAEIASAGGRVPTHVVVRWAVEIAKGLEVAHRAGVVHRDVKPSNVFVTGTTKTARVLDFGIARDPSRGIVLTLPGDVLGTPKYMPPEQLRGAPDIDGRVDVFALGVILYRFFAGDFPFAGDGPAEMLAAMDERAPPLATRRPDIPRRLAEAIDRAIVPARSERWPTMQAFRHALAPFARPPTTGVRLVALGAIFAAIACGGLALGVWLGPRRAGSDPGANVADAAGPASPTPPASSAPEGIASSEVPAASAKRTPGTRPAAGVTVSINACGPLETTPCKREEQRLTKLLASCGPLLPTYGDESCVVTADVTLDGAGQASADVLMRPGHPCATRLEAGAKSCIVRGFDKWHVPAEARDAAASRKLTIAIFRTPR